MIETNTERLTRRLVPHHIPPIKSKPTPTFLVLVILFVLLLRCWCLYPRGFGLRGLGIGCFSILGTVLVLRIKRLGRVNHGAPKQPEI